LAALEKQREEASSLQKAATMKESLAQGVVNRGKKRIAADGDKLPNGGPTYTGPPVPSDEWDRAGVLWSAPSPPGDEYSTRGPTLKTGAHLPAGKSAGNLDRLSLGVTRSRGVDLHVIAQP